VGHEIMQHIERLNAKSTVSFFLPLSWRFKPYCYSYDGEAPERTQLQLVCGAEPASLWAARPAVRLAHTPKLLVDR